MTNRPDCWPYKFKKVGNQWYRRTVAGGRWQALVVKRVGTPANPHSRSPKTHTELVNASINEWTWK